MPEYRRTENRLRVELGLLDEHDLEMRKFSRYIALIWLAAFVLCFLTWAGIFYAAYALLAHFGVI
jgi:NhaP-type Na+/H+ or K+/H+ antiporter